MSINSKSLLTLLLALFTSLCIGCSRGDQPTLGYVKGTVTLDGQPLEGVVIVFNPEKGRAGLANVDADGNYELSYKHGVKGTKLGPTTVSFAWTTGTSGPAIPSKYAEKSELKIDVKKGHNTFDFALESDTAPSKKAKTPAASAKAKPAPID